MATHKWTDLKNETFSPEQLARLEEKVQQNIAGIASFVAAYIQTALWSSNDESDEAGGEPLDKNFSPDDIHPDTLEKMRKECEEFFLANMDDIGDRFCVAGHDFWLTRNRHGAGYWDGDWPEEVGKRLTEAAQKCGEVHLHVGDDGKIHM